MTKRLLSFILIAILVFSFSYGIVRAQARKTTSTKALSKMRSSKSSNKSKVKNTSSSGEKMQALTSKIDNIFSSYYGKNKFSGYVFVSKNGTTLLDKSYGKADFIKNINNSKQTKFEIASITKQITALAVMQLVEKGLINLDDTVDKYLPNFPQGNIITVHQLLCHTSGLTAIPKDYDITRFRPINSDNKDNTSASGVKIDLLRDPGLAFSYSNIGYDLLGYIIEYVSGETLDNYFKENIFDPLNMKNTGFKDENNHISNLAVGYNSDKRDIAKKTWEDLYGGPVLGSSGICSTPEDLITWERALNDRKLINNSSYNKMYTPNFGSYGYGWYVVYDQNMNITYYHTGQCSGFRSYVFRRESDKTIVIILSNFSNINLGGMTDQVKQYLK